MVPTIHLNGTSKQELLDQNLLAGQALNSALSAMINASPNCRDYYPQGPDACAVAIKEHGERFKAIRQLIADYYQLAEAIADGGHKVQP